MRLALAVALVLIPAAHVYAVSGVGSNGIAATGLQLPNTMPLNGMRCLAISGQCNSLIGGGV